MSGLLEITVLLSAPLLLAATGELFLERTGSIHIGLEGTMLVGAFAAFAVAFRGAGPGVALATGGVAGALSGVLFAALAVARRADPILVGAAWNLLALGLTAFGFRVFAGATGSVLEIGTLGAGLFGFPTPVTAAFALPVLLDLFFRYTRPGLVYSAAGENPDAVRALGHSVVRIRTTAAIVSGALAGLGGALLILTISPTFVEGITAGRGFLALSLVVFTRWKSLGLIPSALLFGGATALQYRLQAAGGTTPYAFFLALPSLLALVALGVSQGTRATAAPRALGTPAP